MELMLVYIVSVRDSILR